MDLLKVLILSLVEGITEFLPVSSTGHLILVNNWVQLQPEKFANAFNVIIQLGAILAVVVLYFHRLNPFHLPKGRKIPLEIQKQGSMSRLRFRMQHLNQRTLQLWGRVIVGVLPAMVLGLLFDDFIDEHLMTVPVVCVTLLLYGVLIILLERSTLRSRYEHVEKIPYSIALWIGFFQCLAMVPGTSRSAATIIGAMLLGLNRVAAAEFSFFLAIPTMLGATLLKVVKNLAGFTFAQWLLILLGSLLSFIVALFVIRSFMRFIRRHSFEPFGYYRIVLSIILLFFLFLS